MSIKSKGAKILFVDAHTWQHLFKGSETHSLLWQVPSIPLEVYLRIQRTHLPLHSNFSKGEGFCFLLLW